MKTKVIILSFSFFAVLSAITIQSFGQPTQKPFMWNPKGEGKHEIKLFNKNKKDKLKKLITNFQNGTTVKNFWGMIEKFRQDYSDAFNYLKVYLGVSPSGETDPSKRTLVFIFAPAQDEQRRNDLSYFIVPNRSNGVPAKITKELADTLIDGWFDIAVALKATLNNSDGDNDNPDVLETSPRRKSDTRFVTYCAKDLFKLDTVRRYYIDTPYLAKISDNVKLYFGAYSNNGRPRTHAPKFKKRIMILFELLNTQGKNFYLDSIDDFWDLEDTKSSECPLLKAVDNGQLCPTNCGR